jgi:hypothetical protein
MLNTDKAAPLVHSSVHRENAEMVFNTDRHMDGSVMMMMMIKVTTTHCEHWWKKSIPIKYTVKLYAQLIAGLKQCPCASEQEIMAVYSKRDCLDRNLC